jgi:DNA (cytosine-5)-methyltransferase 1
LRFISFFAGIGGFELGLENVGFECVAQVEIDKHCKGILNKHYPNVKKFGDVKNINPKNLPQADLYVGGFPCQDLSLCANKKRRGFNGERSSLWYEFIRFIENRNPAYVIAENVKGLLSSRKGQDMGIVVRSLVERGYSCEWRVLDSRFFGLAQRRERVFLVATHTKRHIGNKKYKSILFEQERVFGDSCKNQAEESGSGQKSYKSTKERLLRKMVALGTNKPCIGEGLRVYSDKGVSPTLTGTIKNILTDGIVRKLTPLECERLQGFPDNWTKFGINERGEEYEVPKTARYRQCGNAVSVNVAEWIGDKIKSCLVE